MRRPGSRFRQTPIIMALAIGLAVVLAACGSSSPSSSSSASGSSSASSPAASQSGSSTLSAAQAAVAAAEKAPTDIGQSGTLGKFTPKPGGSIYLVSCDLAIVGCSLVAQAMKAATQAIGYKLQVCNTGETQTQMDGCFTNALNAKPSAVITDGGTAAQAGAGYAALKKANIPIIGVFTSNPQGSSSAEVGATTCATEGAALADAVIVGANGKPNALFLTESSIHCDVQRTAAFQAEYQKACPGCTLKLVKFDYATMQQNLPSQVQAALVQNPGVNWVVGVFDQPASVAVTEVQQAGLSAKVKVAGMDGVPANLELIRKGQVQVYDEAVSQPEDAWVAVDAAARIYSGLKVPFDISVVTYLISPDNISSIPADNVWPGPANYPAQFKQLWNNG
jgi:ribose transport system substrate-binding protein